MPSRQLEPSPRLWSFSPAALALIAGLAMAAIAWTSGWFPSGDVSTDAIQVVNTDRPLIRGQTMRGITQAHFTLSPSQLSWTGQVDPETGAFETTVPIRLAPGNYALFLDNSLIAQFSVPAEVAQT